MNRNIGLYWHVHHRSLAEFCYNARERRDYIKIGKPFEERPIRLKLMKPVKNTKGFTREINTLIQIQKRLNANSKLNYTSKKRLSFKEEHRLRNKKARLVNKLEFKFNKVAEERHKLECKNCPWDGHTIFPNRGY